MSLRIYFLSVKKKEIPHHWTIIIARPPTSNSSTTSLEVADHNRVDVRYKDWDPDLEGCASHVVIRHSG